MTKPYKFTPQILYALNIDYLIKQAESIRQMKMDVLLGNQDYDIAYLDVELTAIEEEIQRRTNRER